MGNIPFQTTPLQLLLQEFCSDSLSGFFGSCEGCGSARRFRSFHISAAYFCDFWGGKGNSINNVGSCLENEITFCAVSNFVRMSCRFDLLSISMTSRRVCHSRNCSRSSALSSSKFFSDICRSSLTWSKSFTSTAHFWMKMASSTIMSPLNVRWNQCYLVSQSFVEIKLFDDPVFLFLPQFCFHFQTFGFRLMILRWLNFMRHFCQLLLGVHFQMSLQNDVTLQFWNLLGRSTFRLQFLFGDKLQVDNRRFQLTSSISIVNQLLTCLVLFMLFNFQIVESATEFNLLPAQLILAGGEFLLPIPEFVAQLLKTGSPAAQFLFCI